MNPEVKIIECPRDAWQGLRAQIPTETKVAYLRALIASGFKHIDAVSFVSPRAVPQMADSEQVLEALDPPDDVEIIGIVVNRKGAERAVATQAVNTLGFPYSISPSFLERNQKQTPEDALDELEAIQTLALENGLSVVTYISMAFGNPYGDLWSEEEVLEAVRLITDMDIRQVSLADTVGRASAEDITHLVKTVQGSFDGIEFGVHLHSRPDSAQHKVLAAFEAGCRRFDSALGGLGGCPFAQDALVGNIPTESLLAALAQRAAELPQLKPLDLLIRDSAEIGAQYSSDPGAPRH